MTKFINLKPVFFVCMLYYFTSCQNGPDTPDPAPESKSIADAVVGSYTGSAIRHNGSKQGSNCLCFSSMQSYKKDDLADIRLDKVNDSVVSVFVVAKNQGFTSFSINHVNIRKKGNIYEGYNIVRGNGAKFSPHLTINGKSITGLFDLSFGGSDGACSKECGISFAFDWFNKVEFSGSK